MEETLKDSFLHPHKQKHGFLPRAAGEKAIKPIPRGEPSHGVTTRGKSNAHSRKYGIYPKGCVLSVDDLT
jgi:hypothetical protein